MSKKYSVYNFFFQFEGTVQQREWLESLPSTDSFAHQFIEDALLEITESTQTMIDRFGQFIQSLSPTYKSEEKKIELIGRSGNFPDFLSNATEKFGTDFIL